VKPNENYFMSKKWYPLQIRGVHFNFLWLSLYEFEYKNKIDFVSN